MLIQAALREPEPVTPDGKRKETTLKAQPRVKRDVLLALARQHNPDVGDALEHAHGK